MEEYNDIMFDVSFSLYEMLKKMADEHSVAIFDHHEFDTFSIIKYLSARGIKPYPLSCQ